MNTNRETDPAPVGERGRPTGTGGFTGVVLAAVGLVLLLVAIRIDNPRLQVSWHGFLHTAIAERTAGGVPPENPFFAGEPLPYYWVYHWLGARISDFLGADPIRVFNGLTIAFGGLLVLVAGAIGRRLGSSRAGLLAACLALAGANPLAPAIAAAKHLVRGAPLTEPDVAEPETVFVSDRLADDLMSEPLLPAMFLSADWRFAQNLVWFLDISARGPALAVLLLVVLGLGSRLSPWAAFAIAGSAALLAALNPLVGIASGLALLGARVLLPAGTGGILERFRPRAIGPYVLVLVGVIAVAPTYHQLFGLGSGSAAIRSGGALAASWLAMIVHFGALAGLALYGARKASSARELLGVLAGAGILMLAGSAVVQLPEGNEHNIVNAAQCLLAIPAAAGAFQVPWRRGRIGFPVLVALATVPLGAGLLYSFADRPPIPIEYAGRSIERLPRDGGLNGLYRWVRERSPRNSVFIQDPSAPVKMSGNVAEFPAFTGRALFVDQPSYMTTPHPSSDWRMTVAQAMSRGDRLASADLQRISELDRPVFLISYRADDPELRAALVGQYGAPAFESEFVVVLEVRGPRRE